MRRNGNLTLLLTALSLAAACGCAPPRTSFLATPDYPPADDGLLRIYLAPPAEAPDLKAIRDELVRKTGGPDAAMARVRCVWGPMAAKLVDDIAPKAELVSAVFADSCPTGRTADWITIDNDALGVPRFTVANREPLARLRDARFAYAVVPQSLAFGTEATDRQLLLMSNGSGFHAVPTGVKNRPCLNASVALIEVATGRVIWTGVISSLRPADGLQGRGLTSFEAVSYCWIMDLLEVCNRRSFPPANVPRCDK